ncbi:hypothetical protein AB0424_28540 [Streptomyces sp. NPDC051180]|uniref:hypothetical protein n=1 Tax=unclassified Streptomyces TaxID=2593676 RepID=UPI00344F7E7C
MTDNAWWGKPAAFLPATTPPAAPARDLPDGIVRARQELERLRDDAIASQPVGDPLSVQVVPWCSPDGIPSWLEGVVDTTRWLLGERPYAPISRQVAPYPELPVGQVRLASEDCIFGHKWHDVSEWYAGAVKQTIVWARGAEDEPRPLFGPPATA